MKRNLSTFALGALVGLMIMARPTPVYGVSKEIVQLQQMVQTLTDQVAALQKAFLEKNAVMTQLVERSADNTNKLQAAIDNLQKTLQTSMGSQITSTNQRLDSQQNRLQLINDSVDELKSRQNKISDQLTQIRQLIESIQPPAPVQQAAPVQAVPQAPTLPPAPALYQQALSDVGPDPKKAMQEFQDYLKYYPTGERAENCQFYIGEIYYTNGDYQRAADSYHDVIDRYPDGNKTAAAHLRLGMAMLEMRQKDAGAKELRLVIRKYPRTDEARKATDRLKSAGLPLR